MQAIQWKSISKEQITLAHHDDCDKAQMNRYSDNTQMKKLSALFMAHTKLYILSDNTVKV